MPCPIIMKKMKDFDIIKAAVNELEEEHGYNTSVIDKTAFNVNINPATIIGALTGAVVAKKKAQQDILKHHIKNEGQKTVGGTYYKQVENIANNLKIIFTPFSVLIVVKNGTRQITLDTIDTEEMDDDMYIAYQNRDAEYFKNLILNKIRSEVQLAEQMFARRLVEKQLALQNEIKGNGNIKHASELSFCEVLDNMCGIKGVFEKNANSRLGDYFLKTLDDGSVYEIEWGLDDIRPLNKYASVFKGVLNFFGLDLDKDDIRALQGKMLNPRYLKSRLKVGFLPNRVIFVVDNMVVTQLPLINMNEEGFEAFQRNDQEYFKKLFMDELKQRINKEQNPPQRQQKPIEKKANSGEIQEIFNKSGIHPKVYYLELTKAFGSEWLTYDPEVIVKEIEERYGLEEKGIDDIPLNKIWCIQLINNSDEPYLNRHVFEKCVRAFNDRLIDFAEREDNFGLDEIVFALEVMEDLTPNDDIFDNFSADVLQYMAEALLKNNYRVAFPQFIINSQTETEFYQILNKVLKELCDKVMTEGLTDQRKILAIKNENQLILTAGLKIIELLRGGSQYNPTAINNVVDKVCSKLKTEDYVRNIVARNVTNNLAVDVYLQHKQDLLNEQRKLYGV